MRFAHDSNLRGVHYLMYTPLFDIMEPAFNRYGVEMVVTCTLGGVHSKRSLHPFGLAIDLRSRHLQPARAEELAVELQRDLRLHDSRFDVVLEKDHYHVELDIKRGHARPRSRWGIPWLSPAAPIRDTPVGEEVRESGGEEGGGR